MKAKINKNEGIVYSTEYGKICPGCGNPINNCVCGKGNTVFHKDGVVRIGRETKGRKGSGVTIIMGLPLDEKGLKNIAKQFKQKCGTGGTVKAGTIEMQGDHRELLLQELLKLGYKARLSGG
jgi:translation initiation factor 1